MSAKANNKTDTQTGTTRVRHDRLASIKVVPPSAASTDTRRTRPATPCRSFTAKRSLLSCVSIQPMTAIITRHHFTQQPTKESCCWLNFTAAAAGHDPARDVSPTTKITRPASTRPHNTPPRNVCGQHKFPQAATPRLLISRACCPLLPSSSAYLSVFL